MQRRRQQEREEQRKLEEARKLAGLESAAEKESQDKTARDNLQKVGTVVQSSHAKPFVPPGLSAGDRDPVAAHLEGALAALEEILFPPTAQPRGVEAKTATSEAKQPLPALDMDAPSFPHWAAIGCIVLLVVSLIIAVVALISS
eukprot:1595280-Prymnesium_polylepis.1